jgi:endonuclease-3
MRRKERAERIRSILDELYPAPPIPLDHTNPFTLLVAVLLSAQCTDARVNRVTPALFAEADTPQTMATLRVERILEHIRSCGLAPTKAKNIHKLSQLLVDRHQGNVPGNLEELEALPGVGHKTASVVMIQAFGLPAFPVDTHIFRCARRWKLSTGKNVNQVEADLKKIYPKNTWAKLHLQIIYFGREHCPARNHDETNCPICQWSA